jgi:hypothetical protein
MLIAHQQPSRQSSALTKRHSPISCVRKPRERLRSRRRANEGKFTTDRNPYSELCTLNLPCRCFFPCQASLRAVSSSETLVHVGKDLVGRGSSRSASLLSHDDSYDPKLCPPLILYAVISSHRICFQTRFHLCTNDVLSRSRPCVLPLTCPARLPPEWFCVRDVSSLAAWELRTKLRELKSLPSDGDKDVSRGRVDKVSKTTRRSSDKTALSSD